MGLIIAVLKKALYMLGARCSPSTRSLWNAEDMAYDEIWEGPDDTWPEEEIADTESESELLVTEQWGLALPDGTIAWGSWHEIGFADSLDRARMVATLQKTAQDVGFGEGERIEEFLRHYGWATRNQIATVVYEDTGTYPLTDPEVFATPDGVKTSHDQSTQQLDPVKANGSRSHDSSGDLREGPVGGVAE